MKAKQLCKSITLDFNAFVIALAAIAASFGIDVPADVTVGIVAIINFILRFVTKKPLAEK